MKILCKCLAYFSSLNFCLMIAPFIITIVNYNTNSDTLTLSIVFFWWCLVGLVIFILSMLCLLLFKRKKK